MKNKYFKYIAVCGVLGLTMASCDDWLDVNVDPDSPSNESIAVENRLPWIQKEYTYAAGCANTRTFATCGGFYSNNANMNAASITWNLATNTGLMTTPYQCWFTGTSSNVIDMYNKAEAEGAYHYMGAAEVMKALGFMLMVDLYGEMPYTEALPGNAAPAYDDGKTIWEGCLASIDHAIELFSTPQAAGATSLSAGDIWNGGDVQKWIKLCYGLKARWLLRVTKNAEYYNPQAILAALDQALQSNNDNTFQACFDVKGDMTDFLLGDPIQTNGTWDTAAYGKNQWASKYFIDLLTNMRGAGVEDPRTDKLVPSSMTNIVLDESGKVKSNDWRRAVGVDMFGDAKRLVAGGATSIAVQTLALQSFYDSKTLPMKYAIKESADQAEFVAGFKNQGYELSSAKTLTPGQYKINGDTVEVAYRIGSWFVNSTNYVLAGDTAYVNLCSGSQNTNNGTWGMPANDTYYHSNEQAAANAGAVSGTGSFQIYAVSDFDVITYAEMCFIKAEVLMRNGDASGALTAYKTGIQESINRIQSKLQSWSGAYANPSMQPMDAAAISGYMSSAAVCQSAGELTMSDIMLQKYIAMGWSIENWVDMRRFNFSAGNVGGFGVVYPGYRRPELFIGSSTTPGSSPDDPQYWIRRWKLPTTLELSYNLQNALEMNANATQTWVWSIPVWWDCTSDAEYQSYLR